MAEVTLDYHRPSRRSAFAWTLLCVWSTCFLAFSILTMPVGFVGFWGIMTAWLWYHTLRLFRQREQTKGGWVIHDTDTT